MTPCNHCGRPAAWRRERDGTAWCSGHLPLSGEFRPVRQEVEPDIVDELLKFAMSGSQWGETATAAAAEIRRLLAQAGSAGRGA